jgi:AbrB family looped-hinge helix DNA binding protein
MINNNFSRITSKGQVTIPQNIREKLQLSAGSRLEFVIQNNSVLLMPINNKLSNLLGVLPKPQNPLTVEQMNNIIKEKDDRN